MKDLDSYLSQTKPMTRVAWVTRALCTSLLKHILHYITIGSSWSCVDLYTWAGVKGRYFFKV